MSGDPLARPALDVGDLSADLATMADTGAKTSQRRTAQKKVETALVAQSRCDPKIVDGIRLSLFRLDSRALAKALSGQMRFSSSLQREVGCTVDAIVFGGRGGSHPLQEVDYSRLHDFLLRQKQIGEKSEEGVVVSSGLGEADEVFALKAPRDPEADELIHEAACAFLLLNPLREKTPNFMFVYAAFQCTPPALGPDKRPITWCNDAKVPVTYLVLENVRNSSSLGALCRTLPPERFLPLFLQVINALNLAFRAGDFTHFDLHSGNVLVQEGQISVPFFGKGNERRWLNSWALAVIIDFGFVHFRVAGKSFGRFGFESAGLFYDRSFPLWDTYKLLGFCAEEAIRGQNGPLVRLLQVLFDFFGEGSIVSRVLRRVEGRSDYYEPDGKWSKGTHDQYLAYLEAKGLSEKLVTDRPLYPPARSDFLPLPDYLRAFQSQSKKAPETAQEFVTAVKSAQNLPDPEERRRVTAWLKSNFDPVAALRRIYPRYERELAKARKGLRSPLPLLEKGGKVGKDYEEAVYSFLSARGSLATVESIYSDSLLSQTISYSDEGGRYLNRIFRPAKEAIDELEERYEASLAVFRSNNRLISAALRDPALLEMGDGSFALQHNALYLAAQ